MNKAIIPIRMKWFSRAIVAIEGLLGRASDNTNVKIV
jgi:hypothetical protein